MVTATSPRTAINGCARPPSRSTAGARESWVRGAAALGVWLIPGTVPELGDEGRVYNTQVVFDPSGDLVASYRKVFPWRPYEAWSSGHEFAVFDMAGSGRAGLSICYDAWFPESTRSVAWLGAEFVVNVVKTSGPTASRSECSHRRTRSSIRSSC